MIKREGDGRRRCRSEFGGVAGPGRRRVRASAGAKCKSDVGDDDHKGWICMRGRGGVTSTWAGSHTAAAGDKDVDGRGAVTERVYADEQRGTSRTREARIESTMANERRCAGEAIRCQEQAQRGCGIGSRLRGGQWATERMDRLTLVWARRRECDSGQWLKFARSMFGVGLPDIWALSAWALTVSLPL